MIIMLIISMIIIAFREVNRMECGKDEKDVLVGVQMAICAQMIKRLMDERLRRYGLTRVQAHVMLYLIGTEREGGEVNQKDLERLLQIRAPTVNGIVDRLEEKGFLTRNLCRHDGRCRCLLATEKGRMLEREISGDVERAEALTLYGFTEEERKVLHSLLARVIKNLKGGNI